MIITLAAPGDPTDNATQAWPAGRTQVDAGTVVIDRASADTRGPCNDITFDPLVLPAGIQPSNDPLLSARSAAYASSFTRRATDAPPRASVLSVPAAQPGARP